jgi:hypothetical protein
MNFFKLLIVVLFALSDAVSAQIIRGGSEVIEEAFFILQPSSDNDSKERRSMVFIKNCSNCSDQLLVSDSTEVITTVNQIKLADFLQNNTTYFAGRISYSATTHVVSSIKLSQSY